MWAVTASSNPASSLQAQRPRERIHSVHSLTCRVVVLIPCPLSGVKDSRRAYPPLRLAPGPAGACSFSSLPSGFTIF